MLRDDMIVEISMRTDVPMEDVSDVLDEEKLILEEEKCCRRKKRFIFFFSMIMVVAVAASVTLYLLDKKQKIDLEETLKKYMDKIRHE